MASVEMNDGTIITIHKPTQGPVVKFPKSFIRENRLKDPDFKAPILWAAHDKNTQEAASAANTSVKNFQKRLDRVWKLGYKPEDFFLTCIGDSLQ